MSLLVGRENNWIRSDQHTNGWTIQPSDGRTDTSSYSKDSSLWLKVPPGHEQKQFFTCYLTEIRYDWQTLNRPCTDWPIDPPTSQCHRSCHGSWTFGPIDQSSCQRMRMVEVKWNGDNIFVSQPISERPTSKQKFLDGLTHWPTERPIHRPANQLDNRPIILFFLSFLSFFPSFFLSFFLSLVSLFLFCFHLLSFLFSFILSFCICWSYFGLERTQNENPYLVPAF